MEQTRVSTPAAARPAPAAPTTRSKAPESTATDAAAGGEGAAGGFLSLLSALDDSLNSVVGDAVGEVAGGAVDLGVAAPSDASLLATDAAALMALLAGNIQQMDAGQAGQAGQGASTLSLAQGSALVAGRDQSLAALQTSLQASLQAELLPPGGLVAQTARLDGAADTLVLEGQNLVAGAKRAFSRLPGALSSGLAGSSTAALAASQRSVATDKSLTSAALAAAPGLQAAPERRDAALAAPMPRNGLEVAAPAPAPVALPTPEALAQARVSGDKAATPDGLMDGWGAASAGPEAASTTDLASPLAEPGHTAAEEALAEQVAFWVSENLQNAELTVTHDGKPVEVSVSMSGKEAHIVFGSDQSETRDLLDASMAQLRDLLHSEGLILSGVTVGESGARNANADGSSDTPRGRQGARQAQVLAPVAETRAPRAQILTDRAVDVFV